MGRDAAHGMHADRASDDLVVTAAGPVGPGLVDHHLVLERGLGKLKGRGAKFVSVNPVKTGYSAIADEWVGVTPGTDGLFVLALVHELLRAGKVDIEYLARYTNAPWLVIDAPGSSEDGLFARDAAGRVLCWDRQAGAVPALEGEPSPGCIRWAARFGSSASPIGSTRDTS